MPRQREEQAVEFVRVEVDGGVATVRVDRPKMNALSRQVQLEIREAADECARRDDVRAVVLWGGDKVFAAGADIKEMDAMSYTDMAAHAPVLQAAFAAVAGIPKPVIAAIAGYALGGGCELALACDFRVAGENAVLGQPEVKIGIIPGAGGTQRLARLVGPARAKDIVFSGRQVTAAEALALGLVDRLAPADEVYETARTWAATFVTAAPLALAAAKDAIDHGLDGSLDAGLAYETALFAGTFATADKQAGFKAFLGKVEPTFEGR